MASFNQIVLLGNIGSVDVRAFSNGNKLLEVSLATTKRYKDRNGELQEDTQWHRLVFSGTLEENAERLLHKGDPLFVTGEMTYRKYTTKDGQDRLQPEVRVTNFQILAKPQGEKGGNGGEDLPF